MNDNLLPKGFRFAGVHCAIKPGSDHRDLALIVSDHDCQAAGMFTTNNVRAAPVQWCQKHLPSSSIRAVVINSGNANACTGDQGNRDVEVTASELATLLATSPKQVLVCSTGVIGRPLPMERVRDGIAKAFGALQSSNDAFADASQAIMTTDTRPKTVRRTVMIDGSPVQILGMAKGAAMIGPNMATMLAFVMTDAVLNPGEMANALQRAVDLSFHCIGVEGHTSTNDTVLLLANGSSRVAASVIADSPFDLALKEVCIALARAIIDDAEGASHIITLDVNGLRSNDDARKIAKAVAESALVKSAFYGHDPNWGRICSAAGYAGVRFEEKDMTLSVNGTLLYDRGQPTAFDASLESSRMKANREVHVQLSFSLGQGSCRFWTCDLTPEYVHLNGDYTT